MFLAIASITEGQSITVRPTFQFDPVRGVYTVPAPWNPQMLLCIAAERLEAECYQAIFHRRDLATVFDPESYRGMSGAGVYLDRVSPVQADAQPLQADVIPPSPYIDLLGGKE